MAVIALVAGLTSALPGTAGAANSIQANKAYAQAQLLKLSNVPHGFTKSGSPWVGTSDASSSSSQFTMTQYPDIATCMGQPPGLSVVAAEASSPDYFSNNGDTDVFDVADVYTSADQAKADFPTFNNPKFANCFLKVEGAGIVSQDKPGWPTGATFGTQTASVTHQKYGDASGLLEVDTPVTLPSQEGTSNDFFVALVIRQGRSVAELMIDQGNTPPSASLTASLAKSLVAKMKAHPPGNTIIAT
jgi:hypothetical protein